VIGEDTRGLRLFSAGVTAVFAVITIAPAALILAAACGIGDGASGSFPLAALIGGTRAWMLLATTTGMALGAACVATALGIITAVALTLAPRTWRRPLMALFALPLLLPPYISAIAFADVLGGRGLLQYGLDAAAQRMPIASIYSAAGVILVLGLCHFPIVTFLGAVRLARYDVRFEEPARLCAGRFRILRAITIPLLAPTFCTGAIVVFILALTDFAVPSLLQVNVYTVEIYSRFSAAYDIGGAAAMALPLLLLGYATLRLFGYVAELDRLRALPPRPSPPRVQSRWRAPLLAAAALALLAAAGFPLAVLIHRSASLAAYVEIWQTARGELAVSIALAAVAATCMMALAFAMAILNRMGRPVARAYSAAVIPFLASGPITGVALILLWNHAGPAALIYDGPAILVIAAVTRGLFFAFLTAYASFRSIPMAIDEAAAANGVPWHRRMLGIHLPLSLPALAAIWALGFVLTLRDVDTAVLVAPPGWTPLSVRLFGLMHYGPSAFVAALSVTTVLIIVAGVAAAAIAQCGLKRIYGRRHGSP